MELRLPIPESGAVLRRVAHVLCWAWGGARRYLKLPRISPLCGWGEQNTDDPQPVNSPSTAAHQRCELIDPVKMAVTPGGTPLTGSLLVARPILSSSAPYPDRHPVVKPAHLL